jgi:hypothetical protein
MHRRRNRTPTVAGTAFVVSTVALFGIIGALIAGRPFAAGGLAVVYVVAFGVQLLFAAVAR